MKWFTAVTVFAAGFGLGAMYMKYRIDGDTDRKIEEAVAKEFEAMEVETDDDDEEEVEEEVKAEKPKEKTRIKYETIIDKYRETQDKAVEDESYKPARSSVIQKAEFGILNYDTVTVELFHDGTMETTYGNPILDPEEFLGVDNLEDIWDSDDQTSAYLRNDVMGAYYEVIREV